MRPSSPLKIVHIPGDGDIVGVSASPFSKTLVATVTSNGDVALVDLDKDNGYVISGDHHTCLNLIGQGTKIRQREILTYLLRFHC